MERDTTERRLADLNAKVDHGFEQVDQRFEQVDQRFDRVEAEVRELRTEMKTGFERVDRKFERLQEQLDERFDGIHRTMIQFCSLMLVTLLGVVASMLVAQL